MNDKISQKTEQVVVFKPFSTGMDPDFYIFLASAKSRKNVKYILQMKLLTARQRGNQRDKKQILHRTTTLYAGPINQEDNDSF